MEESSIRQQKIRDVFDRVFPGDNEGELKRYEQFDGSGLLEIFGVDNFDPFEIDPEPMDTETETDSTKEETEVDFEEHEELDAKWAEALGNFAFPADVFAITAYLLDLSGAFAHYGPSLPGQASYSISTSDIEELIKLADEWREGSSFIPPSGYCELWQELVKHLDRELIPEIDGDNSEKKIAQWVPIAHKLMIIADEACKGLYEAQSIKIVAEHSGGGESLNWVQQHFNFLVSSAKNPKDALSDDDHVYYGPQSICYIANRDVVSVLPKSRVTKVGCSHRAFSQHLTLLTAQRGVSTHIQTLHEKSKHDDAPLNVLLVPYPFTINATDFAPTLHSGNSETISTYGVFELQQNWLKKGNIVDLTIDLVEAAKQDVGAINAVVFPEYSLNWNTYMALSEALSKRFPNDIEFLIAGSSDNCQGERGNCVISSVFSTNSPDHPNYITSRRKHHRWRLDSTQIADYHIGSVLDPRYDWWENHAIIDRRLLITSFREHSTFLPMICEDLARMDPCHELVRSIAPSLVFALLMDGPQLPTRWASHYANALADDPGSAVLSFTSKALISRTNSTAKYGHTGVVGLWKDDTGSTHQISCPDGASAVLLTLTSEQVKDTTIDRRVTSGRRAWRFQSQTPIFPPDNLRQTAKPQLKHLNRNHRKASSNVRLKRN